MLNSTKYTISVQNTKRQLFSRNAHIEAESRPVSNKQISVLFQIHKYKYKLEMWANAQRDGRPAEYRWRPLFNAAKFG